ncbi:MAG: glutaminase, partial [Pseudomonadota bacterium]
TEVAQAGLFLANNGLNPISGERVLSAEQNRTVLALMSTCGLYDECGRFAVRVGIPAKSGVSGVMLGIVPGRCAIACYGPALGAKGNSVAGMAMLELLAAELDWSVY